MGVGGTAGTTSGGVAGDTSSGTGGSPTEPVGGTSSGGATEGGASGGMDAGGDSSGGTGAGGSSSGGAPELGAAAHRLTVNGLPEPLDLDVAPRFGWQVNVAEQTAYEIRVASTRDKAAALDGDVWTTGKVASNAQSGILYGGPALAPSERYFWTVRVWGPDDAPSEWSSVASFGTGPGSPWSHSKPIWAAHEAAAWTDYTITARMTVTAVALGIRFRAPDIDNGYMWQFRGGDNRLVPHRLQSGSFSVLETVTLPANTLAIGKEVAIRIEAIGSTIRTFIDDVLVHTTENSTFPSGTVGVRTGNTETGRLDSLSVVADGGETLLHTDFPDGDKTFTCGTVSGGELQVPTAAHCIAGGSNADWAFLRKEFTLADKPIAWATVFATATSPKPAKQYVYKLALNGEFVGLGPTQSFGSEARYDGFDVTSLLVPGQPNTLGALAYTTSGRAFQAELVVAYADGTREVIGTDKTWKGRLGGDVFPPAGSIGTSYYVAPKENIDARRFPDGFDTPGFDDQAWPSASERAPLGTLAAAPMAKVTERLHDPVRIVQKGSGHYFVDFGRTWIGGVAYRIQNGTAGHTVDVRYGEVTSAANTVRYQLNTGNTYQDIYTLTDGPQEFRTWGMRVFRYVEIIGAPEPVTAENLKALALVYPFDTGAALFDASHPNLEQVWQLSKNTIEAVNVNFYTDSWTRERENYEADAYLQLRSALHLTDESALGQYSIDYFENRRTWPTEWPLYVILAAYDTWQATGETRQLEHLYPALVKKLPNAWFEAATGLIRKTSGSDGCGGTDCDIVDWPASQRDGYVFRQYNTVLNALSYRAYRDMAAIASVLGKDDDASQFLARAATLRAAINARLYSQANGRYDDGMDASGTLTGHYSLHASAFALAFGVPEPTEEPKVAEYVASRGMACSVYASAFLLDGLFRSGQAQAALNLLTATSTASWMNMIQDGAGATAEAWDSSMKGNLTYSHPWATAPAFIVPSGLFGIRPLEPGYRRFRVEPRPGDLDYASITVPTVKGTIAAAFAYSSADTFQLAVRVPGNTIADVRMPLAGDTTAVYVDDVGISVDPADTHAEIEALGYGCHIITEEPTPPELLDSRVRQVCDAD